MRIIAGKLGGRSIKVPKSKLVRPTTDKNKEAIFNYLTNKIDFSELKVCDMYAGTGSLGLESISRGAQEVHFVEQNFNVYNNLIYNIDTLSVIHNNYLAVGGILIIERSIQTKDEDVKNFGIEPFKKLGDSLIYEFNFS